MRVRSFFSVKNSECHGKIYLQGCLTQVFEHFFTAVHEDVPECMPEESCARSLLSSLYAGSTPAVRKKRIAGGLVLSFGTQKSGTREPAFVCRNVFRKFVIIWQREKSQFLLRNAKARLACGRIPCDPDRRQKHAFRTVTGALKPSAAAFA